MPRGTLFKLAREKNLLTDLILLGASEAEHFAEVRVVTLHERAHELAIKDVLEMGNDVSNIGMVGATDEVEELLDTTYSSMKEFVRIYEDHILIGVNLVTIDDNAMNYGLKLLLEVPNLDLGEFWELGEEVILRN